MESDSAVETYYNNAIAHPLSSDKLRKKILKNTKSLQKEKKLKRGVKEVVKSIRKGAKGLVVLAADVSPIDVISHIPMLCENKAIPYVYVRSRMELGAASATKKPTSVVLMQKPNDIAKAEKYEQIFGKVKELNPYL